MATDPGLTDICIFLNAGSPWWLSPDISLTGPISGSDKADPNPNNNNVEITVRRQSDCNLSEAIGVINVDVHVCAPSVAITPASATKITNTASRPTVFIAPTDLPGGGSKTVMFQWQIPTSPGPNESPGHKCMIARVYPDDNTPSPTNFYRLDDPHVAQRNICIVPCDPGGGGEAGGGERAEAMAAAAAKKSCSFEVNTTNVNEVAAEEVTLIAVADLNPTEQVREIVRETLRGTPGIRFDRLATSAPQGFAMQFPDFPEATVRDKTKRGFLFRLLRLFGMGFQPKYEAKIRLALKQITRFSFVPDLGNSQPGNAHIFHITQVGPDGTEQGGLTLVFVLV